MSEENTSEEKALYGYCPKCGEGFDKPYTHCPFCNAPNPRLDQDLETKKTRVEELLAAQMAANRAWADMNREEVAMQVEAQQEQNLQDMKAQLNPLNRRKTAGSSTPGLPSENTTSGLNRVGSTSPATPTDPANGVEMPKGIAYGCGGALIWILVLLGGLALLGIVLWFLLH